MDRGRMEDFESPLEQILEGLPEERPPADLKGRCLDALDEAERGVRRSRSVTWRTGLRNVVAAAAGLVLVVGVTSTLMHRTARHESVVAESPAYAPAEPPAEGGAAFERAVPAEQPTEDVYGEEVTEAEPPPDYEAPQAPEAPSTVVLGGAAPGEPTAEPELAAEGRPAGGAGRNLVPIERLPAEPAEPAIAEEAEATDAVSAYRVADARPTDELVASRVAGDTAAGRRESTVNAEAEMAAPSPPVADTWRAQTYAPAKPWRDTTGDRQKRTHKQLDLEVQDVEEAYGRAVSIIEKADGYVDSDEITVEQSGVKRARISARIPVKNLEGTLAQLRDLGEVVSLVGQSEDRTKEYQGRGADIRDLGARECELVDKYLKERDRHRKRALYQQIMAIREQNRERKQTLLDLSDQTHFAFLDLTLIEKGGPGKFMGRVAKNMGTVAGWLAATAIFWVPVLVLVALFWRRRRPDDSE